ncbi:2,3-dihydro-2,3-dihydroxybenzoate dehydrogenase [Herpetosiphon llansteffanensis]
MHFSEYPELNKQVALVTGAAQGIGAAVAQELCRHGVHVVAIDVQAAGLHTLQQHLEVGPGQITPRVIDVRNAQAVAALVEDIENQIGPIGLLVNVAGILRMAPVVELTDEDWTTSLDVNATGVFNLTRAVARRMVPRRAGSIVTVGSNAAGVPRMQMAAYAASKAAATAFSMCLGLELAQHNIRCNVVSPGSTDTAMQRMLWHDETGPQRVIAGSLETFRLGIPLGRIAEPADIANAVVFLLSERARHITMHDLRIDGGATLDA